jgi:hypothetical protein
MLHPHRGGAATKTLSPQQKRRLNWGVAAVRFSRHGQAMNGFCSHAEKRAEFFAFGGCDDGGALAAITFAFLVAAFTARRCLKTHVSISQAARIAQDLPNSLFLVAASPRYAEA